MIHKGIAHCSFLVSSLKESLVFYCDVLGMAQDLSRPEMAFPGAWLIIGTQQIHLLQLENPDPVENRPPHGGRDRHTAILIDGFEELKATLVRENIDITLSTSGRRAFFCRDPDGNTLEFIADN